MSSKVLPKSTKAVVLRKATAQQGGSVYHNAVLEDRALPPLRNGEVLVRINAAAFNHRDVWQRLGKYPGTAFGAVFGSDGAGIVIASGDKNDALLHKRVFLTPMRGWESDPERPETEFRSVGGGADPDVGTFAQHLVVERSQVLITPDHLDDLQAAAWPLGGLTAWRAAIINGRVSEGDNVLITGIGGGVALTALQLCLARNANVYVSSSSGEKIHRAVKLGARGGVNYKSKSWPQELAKLLSSHGAQQLDCIIDSGGGDIMARTDKLLRSGGRVVVYGMTAEPLMKFTMRDVLKNKKLLGSTMGSHQDLVDATRFIAEHRVVPVVSHVLDGLESVEEGFELLRQGEQFGKIVVRINGGVEKAKL